MIAARSRVLGGPAMIAWAGLALSLAGAGMVADGIAVPVRAHLAQIRLDRDFDKRLANSLASPTAPSPTVDRPLSYKPQPRHRLRMVPVAQSEGPIAKLKVARLGVSEIVLADNGDHEQLARGPTMLKFGDTANPVTILAAHRDTHFHFIRDLREGDEVTLQSVSGVMQRYRITRLETVRWNAFAYPRDPARPQLVLVTCYPFDGTEYGGPWRRVAWADQVS